MKLGNTEKLFVSCAVPILVGLFGAFFTTDDSINNWYANLNKPVFTPPDWLFGPVWTTLYILMGISAFLVWRKGLADKSVRKALVFFIVQLVFNALWSLLFFGLRSPLLGLIDIFLLQFAIILTLICFEGISISAVFLLVPYLGWVTFAAILNLAIYFLNR
jgi:tryptophan-rich sensory protein